MFYHINMIEQTVHFRRRGLDFGRRNLSSSYHIQEPNDQGFPSNTNAMLGVPKPSFAESVFHIERPAGGSGMGPFVRPEQKHAFLMTYQIRKFCPPGGTVLLFVRERGRLSKLVWSCPSTSNFSNAKRTIPVFRSQRLQFKKSLRTTFSTMTSSK